MKPITPREAVRALLDAQTAKGRHSRRKLLDRVASYGIAVGGGAVIVAVMLIFFYLLSVVYPVFRPVSLNAQINTQVALPASPLLSFLDEDGALITSVSSDGYVSVAQAETGEVLQNTILTLPEGVSARSALLLDSGSGRFVVGLSNGQLLIVAQTFKATFDVDNKRHLTPELSYPYGETAMELDTEHRPLVQLAGATGDDGFTVAGQIDDTHIAVARYEQKENLLEDTTTLSASWQQQVETDSATMFLLVDPVQQWLYTAAANGKLQAWSIKAEGLTLQQSMSLTAADSSLTDLKFLVGGISLMAGDSTGHITQWFRVRDEKNAIQLKQVRQFQLAHSPITHIVTEARRKGFVATDKEQHIGVFYTTSERTLLRDQLDHEPLLLALNARANGVVTVTQQGQVHRYELLNEHPEISWSALWGKVWFESYEEPTYTWQSSAATNDFEAKFSLVPLVFGTLKAALYAMLFALPIGLAGAMYTAYFMSPQMRQVVKPVVEIMAALPSVILGFVAGLWLAPLLEENLPGIFALLLLLPVVLIGFGLLWHHAPERLRQCVPGAWQAALLIPIIVGFASLCFAASPVMEQWLFNGNAREYITNTLGLGYAQRNSLIVGIAMGFAVIPSVFSIAEDAIFGVPRSLINGSLALGASPWQTMARVVLPTASPGLFSAVMMGMGRAVGETMIVLMATGNTPIMQANIFEGLRSLSATIATEMPESELGSSHYRVLFLAALVLFLFTLVFNTFAEVVRARLRRRYGSL